MNAIDDGQVMFICERKPTTPNASLTSLATVPPGGGWFLAKRARIQPTPKTHCGNFRENRERPRETERERRERRAEELPNDIEPTCMHAAIRHHVECDWVGGWVVGWDGGVGGGEGGREGGRAMAVENSTHTRTHTHNTQHRTYWGKTYADTNSRTCFTQGHTKTNVFHCCWLAFRSAVSVISRMTPELDKKKPC